LYKLSLFEVLHLQIACRSET